MSKLLTRLLLMAWTILVVGPLVWTLYSSLKNNMAFFKSPWALPDQFHFENYYNAWVSSNISAYFLNSVIVVGASLLILLLMSSTTAFVLAKYKFWGDKLTEGLYVACMGIPMVLVLVPLYFFAQTLHVTDSLIGLIVVYPMIYLPFSIFMLLGFFKGVPNSLIEAAMMEGASEYRIFFSIMLPLVKSGLFIVSIVNLMNYWNEYPYALTFLSSEANFTVPIGINYLAATMEYRTDFGALFAGLVISMVPVLVVYAVFNKQLQYSMSISSAVKG